MERLAQQNYFDKRRRADESSVAENIPIDISYISSDEDTDANYDFSRDWTAVRTACMNFGRDRFDILRSLSRNDIQVLVGHGCPSMDSKVVFSAKLLRKYVHLDEGDVCSSCSLRNSCSRGYILTLKEDEARTIDVMRILLTFGFEHVNGAVENKPILKVKSMKTVVRKLLNEVVKLSAVPIDPNLPQPVIRKPPPKVKQPPPPPRKRVGRDDVEMKKGDWLCVKCDFMNFAKNSVCLQCDAKRPKRQLLPGEWECPQCNFLNYRRNMTCFHCDHKRPPDDFTENQMQAKHSIPHSRSERVTRINDVSNAWNFDFDDNESDGADVAAFEFAHPPKLGEDSSLDNMPHGRIDRGVEDDMRYTNTFPRTHERGRNSEFDERKSSLHSHRTGFDDFDDEEDGVDSYELDTTNDSQGRELRRKNFSELEQSTDSEDSDNFDHHKNSSRNINNSLSGSEDDDLVDHPDLRSSHVADSWRKAGHRSGPYARGTRHGSDDDAEFLSDSDDDVVDDFKSKKRNNHQQNLGRGVRREIESDPDDDLFLGSESEDDDYRSSAGRKMRGSGREFRSNDRVGSMRNSFGNNTDEFSSRGSHRHDRGQRRDGHGDRRESNRFQRFEEPDDRDESDPRQRGRFNEFSDRRSNQFNERSRGSRSNGRGSYGGGRRDYGSQLVDRDGSDPRQRGRANQFNDRSRGLHMNGRGSHGGGYGRGTRDGGFQQRGADHRRQGRTDRSRNFDDYNDDDNRARKRIIER